MTSKIKVDNINKVSDDSNIINKCGTTITLGASGDSINLASGATQTGFGRTGTVDWQTGDIKTGTFVPADGKGYFVDTSGGAATANLPAGSAGAIISFSDYTRTFATHNLTIQPNGSEKIGGAASTVVLDINGQALTLVYVDGTEGWINIQNAEDTEFGEVPAYVTASGGTPTTIGDYKYHTFTGPGTLTVSCAGNSKGSNTVQALVVAGGGAGTYNGGGGGGAGGLQNKSALPVAVQGYPICVGGGGPGGTGNCKSPGTNSTFSTVVSAGGGRGGNPAPAGGNGAAGGSGGGGGGNGGNASCGGAGNTPPVSPPQGNPGGSHGPVPNYNAGAGGGGHSCAGATAPSPGTPGTPGGTGGNGTDVSPSFPAPLGGSPAGFYAGGGGGGSNDDGPSSGGSTPSAPGGGGNGSGGGPTTAGSGIANTGGGGGGAPTAGGGGSGSGGAGIVIIKYKFQN